MNRFIYRLCAGIFLTSVLTAGSAVPGSGLPKESARLSQASADVSELSRQFRSETPSIVVFEIDRVELSVEARRRLDVQAVWIRQHPTVRIRVYGHTVKSGNTARNMALSLRRAQLVVKYLARKGIEPYRLEAMISFGADIPLGGDISAETAGRQTTTKIIGFSQRSTTADSNSAVMPVRYGDVTIDRRNT